MPAPGRPHRTLLPWSRAALVPVTERVRGAEHLGTLTGRANLASWTGNAGDPAGALDQFAALVPGL